VADFRSAAFRSRPFSVDLDGTEYWFPSVTAATWLSCLAESNWPRAVLGLAEAESFDTFADQAATGARRPADMPRLARAALAEAAGRPWWEAERLSATALEQPGVLGTVLAKGVDPSRMTLAAFLAVIWSAITQGAEKSERMRIEAELSVPPPEALEEADDAFDMTATVQQMRNIPGVRVG
jgi:hypothetical protein